MWFKKYKDYKQHLILAYNFSGPRERTVGTANEGGHWKGREHLQTSGQPSALSGES